VYHWSLTLEAGTVEGGPHRALVRFVDVSTANRIILLSGSILPNIPGVLHLYFSY